MKSVIDEIERRENSLDSLSQGLVVSCQAHTGSPLDAPEHIAALAASALEGGAIGFRIEGAKNVAAVRKVTDFPIIGLTKSQRPDTEVYITPSLGDAKSVIESGAQIIALDATLRPRPDSITRMIEMIHNHGCEVMADIASIEDARAAMAEGADIVSTTLSGYTSSTKGQSGPDFDLMRSLVDASIPFAAEGRIWTPEEAETALRIGANFVVVGSAITRPTDITKRFYAAISAAAQPCEGT